MSADQSITRREFIRKAGAVSAGLALSSYAALPSDAVSPADKAAERPNILFAIADDWSWPHAGVYGDKVVKTPVFDRVAAEGVLFSHAFCSAPTCTASRGAILTGQAIHRLEEGGNLHSILREKFKVYPDLLEAAGYFVGCTGKGWGPGSLEGSGRTRNPAGPGFKSFKEFLDRVPEDKPFCFWFGSTNPHRPYEQGSGLEAGMNPDDAVVPPFLPDTPEVRRDILDYYEEVQQFDRQVGELLELLEASGRADNTLVVVTSDNGMPFPGAKANLYDAGTRMPLALRWPGKVKGGRRVDGFVGFTDFAPTFLEAAGLKPPPDMTGRSFLDLLTTGKSVRRNKVFTERERHANARKGNLSYPCRAVRTDEFLYIRNPQPDRWPAGDPEMHMAVGPFGDIDGSPSKSLILDRRDEEGISRFFQLACAKRPEEELYDLSKDPWQLDNVADRPEYGGARRRMRAELDRWMKATADPRALNPNDDRWDRYPYFGKAGPMRVDAGKPNVVFVFSDQQRWDTVGCYGQEMNITPNLDRMASEGVRFEYAFTCQPVCGPARAALQTGKYPAEIGCFTNNRALPTSEKTIAHHLSDAGYEVGYIGKWHLASTGPKDGPDNYRDRGVPPERRGGYKDYWLASDVLEFTSHSYDGHMFNADMEKVEFPKDRYRVDCLTDYAVEYLRTRAMERPFFLFLSYIEPHHQNDHNRYEGPRGSQERFKDYKVPGDLVGTEGDWRENYPDYLGCINSLDSNLGRIREELQKLGLAENTLVFYASDHGSHFRTRNAEYKRSCHDASIRIPMIACGPGFRGGRVIHDLASLIDIPPTILSAAGVKAPAYMRGRPLQGLVQGKADDWPEEVFVQISESHVGRAVRTKKWKYSVSAPDKRGSTDPGSDVYVEDYLYDLENDPHERKNLVRDSDLAEVRRKLSDTLKRRMVEAGEKEPVIMPAP